ncbi:MAG TPA: GNAT family N-acetyltransferase [Actinomadura sp.]|jgi:GNAT superfamily N-acetyltransferase|nr:GNAT family N-acetyltransferase [Actinomadura sp.]
MADVGVRPASREDAGAVARVQVRAWLAGYQEIVPTEALAEMTSPRALRTWESRWADAVTAPPSPRHRVLVATETGTVRGFAAYGPAEDPDQDPATAAELVTLLVDPDHGRAGHGSRLLAAAVDLLREDGFTTLVTWVFEAHEAMRAFLVSAGWAPDGTRRIHDMGVPVTMMRLHTDISGP